MSLLNSALSNSHVEEDPGVRHARVAGVRQGGQEVVFDVVAVEEGGEAPGRTPCDDHLKGRGSKGGEGDVGRWTGRRSGLESQGRCV